MSLLLLFGDGGVPAESAADRAARYGLVAAWNHDDANDAFGANHLTNNNAVTFVGGVGQYTRASLQSLSIADNAAFSGADVDIWCAGRVRFDSKPGRQDIVAKWDATNEYLFSRGVDGDYFSLYTRNSAGGTTIVINTSADGAPPLTTWISWLWWHDSVANTVNIRLNNGTVRSAAWTQGVFDGANAFVLGAQTAAGSNAHNGQLGPVYFGKSPPGGLTGVIAEISTYLCSGVVRKYPADWAPAA